MGHGAASRVQSFGSESRQRSGRVTHFPWWAARSEVPRCRPIAYHRRLACSQDSTAKFLWAYPDGGCEDWVGILAMVAPGVLSKRRADLETGERAGAETSGQECHHRHKPAKWCRFH